MTITNGYCTLAEIRAQLGFVATDTTQDTRLEIAVEVASRAIDDHCNRVFYATTEARYFTAESSIEVFVDDLLSISELETDSTGLGSYDTTWDSTYYHLYPYNAQSKKQPYSTVKVSNLSTYYFPTSPKSVKITGSWGWFFTSTARPIHDACLLWSARLYTRKEAIFGVQGTNAIGANTIGSVPLDPDIKQLLSPYVKRY